MEDTDIIEELDGQEEVAEVKKPSRAKQRRPAWKRMLSYRWIVKNIPFFLFMAVLAVIYIYNGHSADKTVRQMTRVNRELKELQYEYKTLKSEVMFRSKQSELARDVEPFGLKELLQPPVVLGDSIIKK
ncbi:MAG TPA: FtsL-like putative cell division protein [Flavitalea sp.]|nr:FtsL-like putative cell division protein [Flavitalea sp.]